MDNFSTPRLVVRNTLAIGFRRLLNVLVVVAAHRRQQTTATTTATTTTTTVVVVHHQGFQFHAGHKQLAGQRSVPLVLAAVVGVDFNAFLGQDFHGDFTRTVNAIQQSLQQHGPHGKTVGAVVVARELGWCKQKKEEAG